MKKYAVSLLTLAAILAFTPVAFADSYTFNFSAPVNTSFGASAGTISFSLTFTTSGTANADGGYNITSASGTYSDTSDGLSGTLSLFPGNSTNSSALTDGYGTAFYDNVLYPNNNAPADPSSPVHKNYVGGYFDDNGLLLELSSGYYINFWADETSPDYNVIEIVANCTKSTASPDACFVNEGDGTSQLYQPDPYTIDSAPEPSSLVLLGTGLLGMAFFVYRKQLKKQQ